MSWASDRQRDRKKGAKAEYLFKNLLENYGYRVELTQKGLDRAYKIHDYVGGDAFIYKPIAHVEIKRKYPTYDGYFGIELYRLSDYLKIQKLLGIPVYYVINVYAEKEKGLNNIKKFDLKNNSWIFERFDILWEKLKNGFMLMENRYIGKFKLKNDGILDFIDNIRKNNNRIYIKYDEIENYLEPTNKSEGKIKLNDISYYRGDTGETATLVYFRVSWFRVISEMFNEI